MKTRELQGPHRARWVAFACALGMGLLFVLGTAAAASFNINPTRVELSRERATETITISNPSGDAVAFEVAARRWTQNADGSWLLEPSDDLVVHPLIVEIPAHGAARLRVGALSADVPAEQAYRVELQQLPGGKPASGAQVLMLTRVSIPVFLRARQVQREVALEAAVIVDCVVRARLLNSGTTYVAPQQASLRLLDAHGMPLQEESIATGYVLPGAALPLSHPVPSALCARVRKVELQFDEPAVVVNAVLTPTAH